MAEIELAPLSHRLDDDEVKLLAKRLKDLGVSDFDKGEDLSNHTLAARLSEEAMTEFLDRLDAHDMGADIYLPIEFDGRVTVGEYRVDSTHSLQGVLEEMKEALGVSEAEEYEDEEEVDEDVGSVIEAQLRHIWQRVSDGAAESVDK